MIFLVEYDDDTRSAISLLLECEALSFRAFSSYDELRQVELRDADCLILDVSPRGVTGLEFSEQLRKQNRALPVILLSGQVTAAIENHAAAAGAFVLEKPFSGSELVETVRRAIAGGYKPVASC